MIRIRAQLLVLAVAALSMPGRAWAKTFVVDQGHAAAADTNPGTGEQPLKTIGAAAKQAQPGDTVSIKPGLYREAVLLDHGGTKEKPIVFEATEPGQVVVDGADPLTGWKKDEGDRPTYSVDWPYEFRVLPGPEGRFFGYDLDPKEIKTAEQVLWDGVPLRQVLTLQAMGPGTFFADWDQKRLHVWLPDGGDANNANLQGGTREVLFGPRYFFGSPDNRERVSYVTVRGIVFRHGSNFHGRGLLFTYHGWIVEDCVFERSSGTGTTTNGENVTLARCVFQDNGGLGVGAWATQTCPVKKLVLRDCIIRRNNLDGESAAWGGSGAKWGGGGDQCSILNVASYANAGHGLWFDSDNRNIEIRGCRCFANYCAEFAHPDWVDGGSGIFIEISPGPCRVENNLCYSNAGPGIQIAESQNTVVENNILVGNSFGIQLRNIVKRSWDLRNVTVRHNLIKDWQKLAIQCSHHEWPTDAAAKWRLTIRENFYSYELSAKTPLIKWGPRPIASVPQAQSLLGICTGDRPRSYHFKYPLVYVKARRAKPIENIETRLAGTQPGNTVVIPAYGRTRLQASENEKWSTWVCDLDGGWVRLAIPNKSLGQQVHKRIRNFPSTLPTMILAKLTATSPYLQATVTKVGPQPIDDEAIEAKLRESAEEGEAGKGSSKKQTELPR